jgi:hypothetical protein
VPREPAVDARRAERLAEDLTAAHRAAEERVARPPLGLRAVETAVDRRWYLCAFEGPSFLCLTSALAPERAWARVREVAAAGLLVEHAEAMVEADALRDLAGACGRLLALGTEPRDVGEAVGRVAERALALAGWREAPERALASLVDLERGVALQDRLYRGWEAFTRATEPLVDVQDQLGADLVDALRDVERAAAGAGAAERLAQRLGGAMSECDAQAEQVTSAHLTRLE